MTAVPVTVLTVEQLDVVLGINVHERHALQDQLGRTLDAIDQRTRRIEYLLEQRAQAGR